jgi:PTS system nitrogen regulatory IIA component
MRIAQLLDPASVLPELAARDASAAIDELASALSGPAGVPVATLAAALRERERLGATGIGAGLAIPHGRVPGLQRLHASFGRSTPGIDFGAADRAPAHFIVALVAPAAAAGPHVTALARISRLFRTAAFRDLLMQADSADALHRLLVEEDARAG